VVRVARRAVSRAQRIATGAQQPVDAQVSQAVRVNEASNLLDRQVGRNQLISRRSVNSEEAGSDGWRTAYANVHFACAGVAHHLNDLLRSRPANDRIVDQNDAKPFDQVSHRVQFYLDAEVANGLFGLDEGPAYVVVAHKSEAEFQTRFRCIADCGRGAGV